MKEIIIGNNEYGQRLDKFAVKFLPLASKGFIYKMIRKKNITLNDGRCQGSEILEKGDKVKFWLSDETVSKFQSDITAKDHIQECTSKVTYPDIIYEDDDILVFNKPAGLLSQKSKPDDISINEILITYLLGTGSLTEEDLKTFRPSVCNRLDRNTSGLIICGKSLKGLQETSEWLRTRTAHKDYIAFVKGKVSEGRRLSDCILKDSTANKVSIGNDGDNAETLFKPLYADDRMSVLMVRLVTGKTHQIRAHLASTGHPILGDQKYGDGKGARRQMLHAYRLTLPDGRIFIAPLPEDMKWELLNPEAFEDLPWKI